MVLMVLSDIRASSQRMWGRSSLGINSYLMAKSTFPPYTIMLRIKKKILQLKQAKKNCIATIG